MKRPPRREDTRSFWSTLPGTITAVGGAATALAAAAATIYPMVQPWLLGSDVIQLKDFARRPVLEGGSYSVQTPSGPVQGAKSAVMTAHQRNDRISRWVLALRQRSGWQRAVIALANKNARILWAVMTRGETFDANHLVSSQLDRHSFLARRDKEDALTGQNGSGQARLTPGGLRASKVHVIGMEPR